MLKHAESDPDSVMKQTNKTLLELKCSSTFVLMKRDPGKNYKYGKSKGEIPEGHGLP